MAPRKGSLYTGHSAQRRPVAECVSVTTSEKIAAAYFPRGPSVGVPAEWFRLGTVAGVGGVRFVDEVGFAFGWIAPEPGFMQRASHAVAAQGRVWVLDPVADQRALGACG